MSTTPGGPEYLDADGPTGPAQRDDNRKRLIALGGVLAAGAVIGGGAWAATSFFSTGAQPAEALPASTIGYVSVDLDPSGGQKIEAIKTLRKFPGIQDELDLDTDEDLRERLFTELTESGECEGLDYEKGVKPWLGSRAAVAAVETGQDEPTPVGVIQVSDEEAAEKGMANLVETCGGSGDLQSGGWVVDGDWAVIAETEEIAQDVVDEAAKAPLSSDKGFTKWTDEAGGDGIFTMYAAKEAASYLADLGTSTGAMGSLGLSNDLEPTSPTPSSGVPDELNQALEEFQGAAATVRFDGGALEIEMATSASESVSDYLDGDAGAALVGTLPEDTVAAFGVAFKKGWVDAVTEKIAEASGGETTKEDLYAEASEATGLDFPADLETLLGDGTAMALGSGIDPDAIANGGPSELPIGVKIKGDADEIEAVLAKLRPQMNPDERSLLEAESDGDYVALSPKSDLRGELAKDGALGSNATYKGVVETGDAQALLFVNFNADDDWLVRVAEDDPKTAENLAPLAAFGISSWVDGDVGHGLVRLTTD